MSISISYNGTPVASDGTINLGNVFSGSNYSFTLTLTNNDSVNAANNVSLYAYDSATSATALRLVLGGNLSNENVYPSMVTAQIGTSTPVPLSGNSSFLSVGTLAASATQNVTINVNVPAGAVIDDQDFYLDITNT